MTTLKADFTSASVSDEVFALNLDRAKGTDLDRDRMYQSLIMQALREDILKADSGAINPRRLNRLRCQLHLTDALRVDAYVSWVTNGSVKWAKQVKKGVTAHNYRKPKGVDACTIDESHVSAMLWNQCSADSVEAYKEELAAAEAKQQGLDEAKQKEKEDKTYKMEVVKKYLDKKLPTLRDTIGREVQPAALVAFLINEYGITKDQLAEQLADRSPVS